jgi:pSer/pThr/pTyr-binding forkhead associated (FHA) protein
MPYLVHKEKDGSTIEFWNLHEGPTTVGRGEVNAKVDDTELSRKHFVVTHEDGGFTLKDLGSTNGTTVNGQRVTEQVLRPNDDIRAGNSLFLFMEGLTTMAGKLDQDLKDLDRVSGKPPSS